MPPLSVDRSYIDGHGTTKTSRCSRKAHVCYQPPEPSSKAKGIAWQNIIRQQFTRLNKLISPRRSTFYPYYKSPSSSIELPNLRWSISVVSRRTMNTITPLVFSITTNTPPALYTTTNRHHREDVQAERTTHITTLRQFSSSRPSRQCSHERVTFFQQMRWHAACYLKLKLQRSAASVSVQVFYINILRTSAVSRRITGQCSSLQAALLVLVIYYVGEFFLNGRGPIVLFKKT